MRWEQGPTPEHMGDMLEAWYYKDDRNMYYALVFRPKLDITTQCISVCRPKGVGQPLQMKHSNLSRARAHIESLMPNLEPQFGPDTVFEET